MASSDPYSSFVQLDPSTPPADGGTLAVIGDTGGSYVLSFSGATVSMGDTMTLEESGIGDGVTYTYTGLTSSGGDPIFSSTDGSGTNYFALTNGAPSSLNGDSIVSMSAYACFAGGTRILTARGEVPVEELVVGDLLLTLNERRLAPLRWIGHTRVACRLHARPWDVRPVRVVAGAFAEGVPLRDVMLSPDHCVSTNGMLIPVRYLANGTTIVQEDVGAIVYWHLELDRHDVLLADGLPAESYLDTGNRAVFARMTGTTVTYLHPEGRPAPGAEMHRWAREVWAESACAPLVEDGPILEAVRLRLAERASEMGQPVPQALQVTLETSGHSFHLIPAGTTRVELTSRHNVPAGERRRLGASITSLSVDGVPIGLDQSALAAGFHEVEDRGSYQSRWTNGLGVLALPASDEERILDVTVELLVQPKLAMAS